MDDNQLPQNQAPNSPLPPQPTDVPAPQPYAPPNTQPANPAASPYQQPYQQPLPPQPMQSYQPVQAASQVPQQPEPAAQIQYPQMPSQQVPQPASNYSPYAAPSRRPPIRMIALIGGVLAIIAIFAIIIGSMVGGSNLRTIDQSELPFTFAIPNEWEVSGGQSSNITLVQAVPRNIDPEVNNTRLAIVRTIKDPEISEPQHREQVTQLVARLNSSEYQESSAVSAVSFSDYNELQYPAAYKVEYDTNPTDSNDTLQPYHAINYFIYEDSNTTTSISLSYTDEFADIAELADELAKQYRVR